MKKMGYHLRSYFFISIGLFVFAFGWTAFVIPNAIVGGGVSGISALVLYALDIPFEYTYFIVNVLLIAIGMVMISRHFGIKTIYAIIVGTFFFHCMPDIIPQWLKSQVAQEGNIFLWVLVGGITEGVGIAMTFMNGGNTGGTDIIALIISKYKHINPGRVLLYCDILVVGSALFLKDANIISVLYGLIFVTVSTYVIDVLVSGSKRSLQVMVFSKHYLQIAQEVSTSLGRGITIIHATGWYTQTQKNVLLVIVRQYELNEVYRIVKEIDKDAFLSTAAVVGVFGEGFEPIKDGKFKMPQINK